MWRRERGIRTLGTVARTRDFPITHHRPLGHLSAADFSLKKSKTFPEHKFLPEVTGPCKLFCKALTSIFKILFCTFTCYTVRGFVCFRLNVFCKFSTNIMNLLNYNHGISSLFILSIRFYQKNIIPILFFNWGIDCTCFPDWFLQVGVNRRV